MAIDSMMFQYSSDGVVKYAEPSLGFGRHDFFRHTCANACMSFHNILHQLCIDYPAVPIDLVLHIFGETFELQIRTVPQKTQCAGKDFPARRQHRPSGLRVS